MSPPKALAVSLTVMLASPPPAPAAEPTPQQRLAGQFVRAAATMVESQGPSVEMLDTSVLLAVAAVELDPDAERWRTLLRFADLAERRDLRGEALGRLVRLDPQDEVVRLLYVNDAIERYQTVEQRTKAYRKLLDEKNRRAIGPAVASRLANDYALLLDRAGDVEGFSRWLAEAVAMDSSNRSAAATAAGFFRTNVDDPFAEAELLTTLVLADPSAFDTQTVLGQLLLEHGAYEGAARLYGLATRMQEATGQPPAGGILADYAVAQWAGGDPEAALGIVRRRQRDVDQLHRRWLRQENPQLTPLELARQHAPIATTLATVRAAIHDRLDDPQTEPAPHAVLTSYEWEINTLKGRDDADPAELARRYLEAAWVALWLEGEAQRAGDYLGAADELLRGDGLSPQARARFEGWIALRREDLTRAVELLAPVADRDPAARLGLALARREAGALRDAARDLYAVYSSQPGTLMGVWASDVLAEMVGQRVSPGPVAARMETLIASIPSIVDRLPDEPGLAVSVRLIPAKTTFEPYEPIIINVEITNNAPVPLAIDDSGPIRPQIAILTSARISHEPGLGDIRPLIVDIDRRLRLEPRQRLIVPVDLRRSALDQVLNRVPLRGATLLVRAILNFRLARPGVYEPGLLGSRAESSPVRVDGFRPTRQNITEAIAAVVEPDSAQDLGTIALLSHVVPMIKGIREADPRAARDEFGQERLEDDAAAAIAEAYTRLDAASRAWLLCVMPRQAVGIAPVYAMAQKDESKLVRLAYLLNCLTGPDDPMIDAGKRGNDPDVRAVAEMMESTIAAGGRAR
jgi:hypothetical protein